MKCAIMRWLIIIYVLTILPLTTAISMGQAAAVNKVFGMNADATGSPAPLPLSASFLCDGSAGNLDCPQLFAPDSADATGLRFYGVTNRTNPPRYVVSVDGGITWGLLATQPYVAAVDLLGATIAVASNGTIIAPANQGANNCIIRVSTDQGVSWSTAFTDTGATDNCGVSFAAPITNNARCVKESQYCAVVNPAGGGAFTLITYFSTDDGSSWTKGSSTDSVVSSDQTMQIRFNIAGTLGVIGYGAFSNGNGPVTLITNEFREGTGFTWNGARCYGSVIMSIERLVCGPDNVATTVYQNFTVVNGVASLINTFTLTDAPLFANSPNFHVEALSATAGYLFGRNLAGTQVNVYVTTDAFASAILIAQLTPTTALIAGACKGESHLWGGKMYFTCGGPGANALFGVIQQ